MEHTTEWATIGTIVAPFGIRGELKVFLLTDVPNRFVTLETIYLGSEHTLYSIEGVRPYKGDMILLKLAGINDATTAESLRKLPLCIPADQIAELPPDSYYQHDILGLQVHLMDGKLIGTIRDILPTGGSDVYIITSTEGKQILIPAVKEVIKQIDLIRQVMYIDPMKGLLDDDAVVVDPTKEEE